MLFFFHAKCFYCANKPIKALILIYGELIVFISINLYITKTFLCLFFSMVQIKTFTLLFSILIVFLQHLSPFCGFPGHPFGPIFSTVSSFLLLQGRHFLFFPSSLPKQTLTSQISYIYCSLQLQRPCFHVQNASHA